MSEVMALVEDSPYWQAIENGSKILIVRDAVPENKVGVTITLPDGTSYKGAIDTIEQRDLLLKLMTVMEGGEEE